VLEALEAQVPEPRAALSPAERLRRVRDEDLAAVPGRGDPGGPVDRHPDRVAALDSDVAGVEAHPDTYPGPVRPRLALERSLAVDGRRDRVARALEHDEEAVALSPTLIATM